MKIIPISAGQAAQLGSTEICNESFLKLVPDKKVGILLVIKREKTKQGNTRNYNKTIHQLIRRSYHHIPFVTWKNSSPHLQNHSSQQPEQASNAVFPLVICRNSNINISHWRISITEGNGRDVAKRRFFNRLRKYLIK